MRGYVKLTEESEIHTHSSDVTISYKDDSVKYPNRLDKYASNGIYITSEDTAARWIVTAHPTVRRMAYVRRVVSVLQPYETIENTGVVRVSGVKLDPTRVPVREFFTVDQIIAATKHNPYVILVLTADELAAHRPTLISCCARTPELLDIIDATIVATIDETVITKMPSSMRHRIPVRFQEKQWYLTNTDVVPWSVFNAEDQAEIAMALARRGVALNECAAPKEAIKPETVVATLDAAIASSSVVKKHKEGNRWNFNSVGVNADMMTPEQFRRCIIELETLPNGPVPDGHWDAGLLHLAIYNDMRLSDPPPHLMTKHLYMILLESGRITYREVPLPHDVELDLAAVTGYASAIDIIPVERHTAELLAAAIKKMDSRHDNDLIERTPQVLLCDPRVLAALAKSGYPVYEIIKDPSVISPELDIVIVDHGGDVPQDRWTDEVATVMINYNVKNYDKLAAPQKERLRSIYKSKIDRDAKSNASLDNYCDYFDECEHPYYDTMHAEFGNKNG